MRCGYLMTGPCKNHYIKHSGSMKGNFEECSCCNGSRSGLYNAVGASWVRGLRVVMEAYQRQLWYSAFGHLCSQCFTVCGASVRSENWQLTSIRRHSPRTVTCYMNIGEQEEWFGLRWLRSRPPRGLFPCIMTADPAERRIADETLAKG